MNSDYASVTNQAGIYEGDKGFDVNVKGNTDLKGAVIDSTATEDKNKLTTGTLSFSDIENKAEYNTSGFGFSLDTSKNAEKKDAGLTPNIPMSSSDDASSTTKSGVAQGTITITNKDGQKQDIGTLNRDTNNTLNKLDQIFDKETIKEKQELADLFAEMSFNAIHDVKMEPEQRAAAHALIGFIAADLAGTKNPGSSMFAAGINELVVQELTKDQKSKDYYDKHPEELQWISAAIGSAVSGMTGGNISGGASIAASGTRNNKLYEDGRVDTEEGRFPNSNDAEYVVNTLLEREEKKVKYNTMSILEKAVLNTEMLAFEADNASKIYGNTTLDRGMFVSCEMFQWGLKGKGESMHFGEGTATYNELNRNPALINGLKDYARELPVGTRGSYFFSVNTTGNLNYGLGKIKLFVDIIHNQDGTFSAIGTGRDLYNFDWWEPQMPENLSSGELKNAIKYNFKAALNNSGYVLQKAGKLKPYLYDVDVNLKFNL